jgi:hypothetical protein
MTSPTSGDKKSDDEKQSPTYSNEFDGRRSSIDTINALVIEGGTPIILRLLQLADIGLFQQITDMRSSSERCRGRKLHGCWPEIKFALLLWLRHGHSREFYFLGTQLSQY